MMRKVLLTTPSNLTAALNLPSFRRQSGGSFRHTLPRFFSDAPPLTRVSELPRVDSLVDGCDYKHWLVLMHPPENYPQREEIIQHYIATLSIALGSEKAAMESIYSVSTKYYYAFGCVTTENLIPKIRSLPGVKWILPDCYLSMEESGYGGEPYVNGKVAPYEEKYHADWWRDDCGKDNMEISSSRKARRGRRASKKFPCNK